MLGFNNTFEVKLNISEKTFLDNLMPLIDWDYPPFSNPFILSGKVYYGHIKFNRFQLSIPKMAIINGTFESSNQSLKVEGRITLYKSSFFLNLLVTLSFLSLFVYALLSNPINEGTLVISAILSIIGICNYCVVIIRLRKIKEDFIRLIKQST